MKLNKIFKNAALWIALLPAPVPAEAPSKALPYNPKGPDFDIYVLDTDMGEIPIRVDADFLSADKKPTVNFFAQFDPDLRNFVNQGKAETGNQRLQTVLERHTSPKEAFKATQTIIYVATRAGSDLNAFINALEQDALINKGQYIKALNCVINHGTSTDKTHLAIIVKHTATHYPDNFTQVSRDITDFYKASRTMLEKNAPRP